MRFYRPQTSIPRQSRWRASTKWQRFYLLAFVLFWGSLVHRLIITKPFSLQELVGLLGVVLSGVVVWGQWTNRGDVRFGLRRDGR